MNEPLFWIYVYLFIAAVHFCAILPKVIEMDKEDIESDLLLTDGERKAVIFLTTFLNAIFWPLMLATYIAGVIQALRGK